MKLRCVDIADFMEELAPTHLAECWDNVGLLIGGLENKVERILLALDVTPESIEEALELRADLMITHHPFIFKGMKSITDDDPKGKLAGKLIRHGISVYSAHTNLDVAEGGVNDVLALKLGLSGTVNFKDYRPADSKGYQPGLGKVGSLKEQTTLTAFAEVVKSALNAQRVKVIGDAQTILCKAAVFCGSFDDDLDAFKRSDADVLVTGDLKYHTALDILQMGKCAIDAGHFNTERVILPVLAEKLGSRFPELDILTSIKEKDPFSTY